MLAGTAHIILHVQQPDGTVRQIRLHTGSLDARSESQSHSRRNNCQLARRSQAGGFAADHNRVGNGSGGGWFK